MGHNRVEATAAEGLFWMTLSKSESDTEARELERLLRNWRAEHDSAVLYDALAELELDAGERDVCRGLVAAERGHAAFWQRRLLSLGHSIPEFRPRLRTMFLIQLARWFGVGFVVPSITVREMRDRDDYEHQDDAQAAGLAREEQAHAAIMRTRTRAAFGNNLRAAVLGANDGLASNFCLMMGVAGGGARAATILLTGMAGLIGGACSMALGEWLSVTNARELVESQIDVKVADLQLETAAPRTGAAFGDAGNAAALSFFLFALGAMVPLLPFCVLPSHSAILGSIVLSLTALFVIGLATTFFNGRSALFSGLRQIAIGACAAAVTYLAGRIFGAVSR
jgi:VIT1/CCC1 family predicted Fe2+/Mn2+ transporter